MFYPFRQDTNSTIIKIIPNFLSKEECEIIIDYGNKKTWESAYTGNFVNNEKIRKNKIYWFGTRDKSLSWLYTKLANQIKYENDGFYNFDLYGLTEDIQFTIYNAKDDHYKWHYDSGFGPTRKLSCVIQLSDPKNYEGCELEFIDTDETNKNQIKNQGTLILFPSYLAHRVTPLISGIRYSLVNWVGGPNFK